MSSYEIKPGASGCGCGGGCAASPSSSAAPVRVPHTQQPHSYEIQPGPSSFQVRVGINDFNHVPHRSRSNNFSTAIPGAEALSTLVAPSALYGDRGTPAAHSPITQLADPYYLDRWQAVLEPSFGAHQIIPSTTPIRELSPHCLALTQLCMDLRQRAYQACLESNRLSALEDIALRQMCVITTGASDLTLPAGEGRCAALEEAARNNRSQAQALLNAYARESDSARRAAIDAALRDLGMQLRALDDAINACVAGGAAGREAECRQRNDNFYYARQRRRDHHHNVTEPLRGEAEELRLRLAQCGLGPCLSQDSYPYVNFLLTPLSHPCPRI